MATVGKAVVEVVADVSGMEPVIRAELDRIAAQYAEVDVEQLAQILHDDILPPYAPVDTSFVAAKLLERFTIRRKPTELESDACES